MGAVTVRVDVQNQTGPVALNGVTVRVYEDDGTTFVTEGVTGAPFAAGRVEFTLQGDGPGISYVLRLSLDGWRFPSGATQAIVVTDPPAPDNDFGPYNALQGSTAVIVTLATIDDQLVPDPISGARLFVYSALDVFITELLTDGAGEVELPLVGSASPGTDYIVRAQKVGVTFDGPTQTISVLNPVAPPNTNIFDFVGHVVEYPESTDVDMCTVYGSFTDLSLAPARKLRLEFKPCPRFESVGAVTSVHGNGRLLGGFTSDPTLVRDFILSRSVKVDTDVDGFFSLELPRKGTFEVHIHGFEEPFEITERIYVPDAASARFIDLLYPYVVSVAYDPAPITVAIDEVVYVDLTVTFSNGEPVTDQAIICALLDFAPADDTIAQVTLSSGTQLAVKGLSAGSTTIVATRAEDFVVPSRPPVAALVVTPPTVNVS